MRFEWIPTVFTVKVMRTIANAMSLPEYVSTDYNFLFAHTYGVTLIDIRYPSTIIGIPFQKIIL